ncbi:24507_t:CDS:1, partial [Gigaspora margarita]
ARADQIRKNISFYGKVIVKEFLVSKRSKAAFIELWPKNTRREEFVKNSWGVHYENEKIVRLTQEKFDKDIL